MRKAEGTEPFYLKRDKRAVSMYLSDCQKIDLDNLQHVPSFCKMYQLSEKAS